LIADAVSIGKIPDFIPSTGLAGNRQPIFFNATTPADAGVVIAIL
jgi:hypothetical protein